MTDETFLDGLEEAMSDDNVAFTENEALAFRTTKSALLDFFATGGALRSRDPQSIIAAFQAAFEEDPLLATKAVFYFRDVRGGQGERHIPRVLLRWLAEEHPEVVRANLPLVPEYGRWDDMYVFIGTPVENDAFGVIDAQLAQDILTQHPTLLAKWLKSENTSSKSSRRLATKTRRALGLTSKDYRKTLSMLRKQIGIIESKISANAWDAVDYERIPSKAGLQYRKAFLRHDEQRYRAFLDAVTSGEKKINVKTLYPYEIVEKIMYEYRRDDEQTFHAMWESLPDYFEGTENRGIVVADTSGSMYGRPITISVSLAMYTAERNKGPFHNKFITFSQRPRLQTIEGKTISQRVNNLARADWDYNTDIEAVFNLILTAAIRNKLTQDQLPTHLYIVSDMEFDGAIGSRYANERLFETIDRRFQEAGYKMPFLVFWNVNSRNTQQPMTMDKRGFQMVSGCSPSIFTSLLKNQAVSAYDLMLEVLNDERYSHIRIEED